MTFSTVALLAACSEDAPHQTRDGSLGGQVVVSGPLRKATVSVDQLDYSAKAEVKVRAHVADTVTDDDGRFSVDVGTYNGLLLVTAKGGSFVDLATGATIQLDPGVGLESIEPLEVLEERDDALVSPVGHLIATRTRTKVAQLGDLVMAERDAEMHVGRHFGSAPWTRIKLAPLDAPATSPTEPIRAAVVHAALSLLAQDIANASGASPQEVNVLTLTRLLAADISQGPFDGNDDNSMQFGEGLQLGFCSPVTSCSAPSGSCALGACRPLCDLYAGTPRALLAGEVTKVIQSPAINHTGLVTGDILAVARSMADNVDEDLFGTACVEQLDRLPPRIDWVAPTPSDGAYVRVSFSARAIASDDTDPRPQVIIDGYPNTSSDSAALAMIDSTQFADGALMLTAEARDMAGNASTIHRILLVDNTPPALTLDPTGYLVDGSTWWTTEASPTLTGTVSDAAPVTVATGTSSGTISATVTASTWTSGVAGVLDLSGADVTVTATDAAGNRTQATQRIRADVTPPVLSLGTSDVRDEVTEPVTFDPNSEAPMHTHTGASVHLGIESGCPSLTKFSYLLGASPPPYGSEVDQSGNPSRNPVQYVLFTSDDGVGLAAGSTQYRVGFRGPGATVWLLDWTTVAGIPTNLPGVTQYTIGIYSNQIPQLATTEGIYNVEFRTTDRLARTVTKAACFELHLRAPPLHFQTPNDPGDPIPRDHRYRLQSLGLAGAGALFAGIPARLLSSDASGASLLDEDITNGTASTVYLDVGVAGPGSVHVGQQFQLNHSATPPRTVSINCTQDPENPPPDTCHQPVPGPTYMSSDTLTVNTNPLIVVKVFELDANLAPTTEMPCVTCGINQHWTFAIPPRSGTVDAPAPPRRFKAMTMIGQLSELWPSDSMFPAMPPFRDAALNGISFTGQTSPANDGCVAHNIHQLPDGTLIDICTSVVTYTPFRAFIQIHLHTDNATLSTYATAPTPVATPAFVTQSTTLRFSWDSSQSKLPCTGISC